MIKLCCDKIQKNKDMRARCKQVWCHSIRHFYCNKNKTVEYNLRRDTIKVCRDTFQEQAQRIGCDIIQEATIEAATQTESSVATDLSMSRQRDQFGPEFWESTTQLMK